MDAGIAFASEKEYRQFIDYIATRNQVNISNLNAIQRFTDTESHPDFIFRFTLSMPIVNTYSEPYLCIRKVPKNFPMMAQLVEKNMMDRATAELLVQRFRQGSTLICGGNSSGKTTLLNALKETLPDDMAILVAQQADELTTLFHPDMMFLHSLPGASESSVNYQHCRSYHGCGFFHYRRSEGRRGTVSSECSLYGTDLCRYSACAVR